ncbi:MAG: DUF4397 domain-containing protein [Myxococcales bacterium]|nr:DUF4397 domain-containing protein [Myxococcales bacterium]
MKYTHTTFSLMLTTLAFTACGDDGGNSDTSGVGTTGASASEATDPTGVPTSGEPATDGAATTDDPAVTTTGDTAVTTTGDTAEPETTAGTTADTDETGGADTTTIRVVHLSPGAPAVDIFANGDGAAPVVDALALRNSITLQVPAGEYEFAVAADGSPIEEAVFAVPKLAYEAGKAYTVVAVGKLAEDTFDVIRFEDDAAGLDPAQLRLQVTHAAAAAAFAEVDVWAGPAPDQLAPLLPDFKFKSTGAADIPPNDLVVGLDADNDGTPDAVWSILGAALAPGVGAVVNVFAYSDDQDAPSLQVVAFDGEAIQLDPS